MADEMRYDRVLQSFEDLRDIEAVYGALWDAILLVERTMPRHSVLVLLQKAREHRISELRDAYEAQKYCTRSDQHSD